MSLQFCIGPSGAGKSTYLYNEVIRRSIEEPGRQFLILVPDQYTMQIQKELVMRHPNGGIMNIDVLSFGRLAHRIFEEQSLDWPVLDDTGKSLLLRRLAGKLKDEMPVIGGHLKYTGYINEVKSAISEFMQYGIGPSEIDDLLAFCKTRGSLYYKMQDLRTIYLAFLEEIGGRFVTTEGQMGLLANALYESPLIKDAVLIFDGFTGFTPIQYQVIDGLLRTAKEVCFSVIMDASEDAMEDDGEQKLFALSKKTIRKITALANASGTEICPPILLDGSKGNRFGNQAVLAHLEKELFRFQNHAYQEDPGEALSVYGAATVSGEIRYVATKIRNLIRTKGYQYRDIAVVCGNLNAYADDLYEEFSLFDIPCYIDTTKGIALNPFIELIRGAFAILIHDFSYQSVFHFLRSGLTDLPANQVDDLENYVIQYGIRGKKAWSEQFVYGGDLEEGVARLQSLNAMREQFMQMLSPMLAPAKTAAQYIDNLYQFIIQNKISEKLAQYEQEFKNAGDPAGEKEYAQIYRLVMQLMEQVYDLIGDETMAISEFAEIMDAGFGEIRVGMIPQNVDRILIGDMERTRLTEIKVLFFVGVNDGNIPGSAGSGGLISDLDREFLSGGQFELSPSPRQKMYTQRLYLYMNLTKPGERLYISYPNVLANGEATRPAYLIGMLGKLFPKMQIVTEDSANRENELEVKADGVRLFAERLRDYATGSSERSIYSLCHVLSKDAADGCLQTILDAAFYRYVDTPLAKEVASLLYGRELYESVSKLETFATCAYRYFLQYGLSLKERRELSFEMNDLGSVYHGTLEIFATLLEEKQLSWFSFTKEQGEAILREALERCVASYGESILFRTAKYRYIIERVYRILKRSIFTMQEHLKDGNFSPRHYEVSFSKAMGPEDLDIRLSDDEKMRLAGRIDRVDVASDEENVYVKVIDYKSGNKSVDLAAIYYGLQLQLVVYLDMASRLIHREYPDKKVVPAAMLYYHLSEPLVSDIKGTMSVDEINEKIKETLKMEGLVSNDTNVAASFTNTVSSKTLTSGESMQLVSSYVNKKIAQFGKSIVDGTITKAPSNYNGKSGCEYCAFQNVCGFHEKTPGCSPRQLYKMKPEDALEQMRKDLE